MTLVLMNDNRAPDIVARVPQGEARREHTLRDLIHDNPTMMPVHELDPSYGRLFTVTKELNIPGVGFVDVLLADERGRLVVVECKLWRNPQARREVVGQILDYARELSRYGYEDLQRQISIATRRHGNVLYEQALAAGSDMDEASFVDRVARDLTAGRFLLLVVGDGIAEGTRRIGEYLRDQPGLAFEFGLVEIAEYRFGDDQGGERVIVHPRLLAQTTVIERHVIRSELPGLVIDPIVEADSRQGTMRVSRSSGTASEASLAWTSFVQAFVAGTHFDDPGQPEPRRGGPGWIRIPLPQSLHLSAYRSPATNSIGVGIRFPGARGAAIWESLKEECDTINREFAEVGLAAPDWIEDEEPLLRLTHSSPAPWTDAVEVTQREWMGQAANQFVNSLRPRLQRLAGSTEAAR